MKSVQRQISTIENVLHSQGLQGDYEGMKALGPVITALCNQDSEGISDGGIYLFYKIRNRDGRFQIFHKRLNAKERQIIDQQPTLLMNPRELLANIEKGLELEQHKIDKLRQITEEMRILD